MRKEEMNKSDPNFFSTNNLEHHEVALLETLASDPIKDDDMNPMWLKSVTAHFTVFQGMHDSFSLRGTWLILLGMRREQWDKD